MGINNGIMGKIGCVFGGEFVCVLIWRVCVSNSVNGVDMYIC